MIEDELILAITNWLERLDPIAMLNINERLEPFAPAKLHITPLRYSDNNDISRRDFLRQMRACFKANLFPKNAEFLYLSNLINDQLLTHDEIIANKGLLKAQIEQTLIQYNEDLINIEVYLDDHIQSVLNKDGEKSSKLAPLMVLYCYKFLAELCNNIYYLLPNSAPDIIKRIQDLLSNLEHFAENDPVQRLYDMEQFALIAWDLYKLDELDVAVECGLRLPGHDFFSSQLSDPEIPANWRSLITILTDAKLVPIVEQILSSSPQTLNASSTSVSPSIVNNTPTVNDETTTESLNPQLKDEELQVLSIEEPAKIESVAANSINEATSPVVELISKTEVVTASPVDTIFEESEIVEEASSAQNTDALDIINTKPQRKPRIKNITVSIKPKSPEQINLDDLYDAIHKLDAEKFNALASSYPHLLPSSIATLTAKINEKHKNLSKLIEFINKVELPFEFFLEFFKPEKFNSGKLDILIKKLCQYPTGCLFDEDILKNYKNINKDTAKLLTKFIENNNVWLETQIDAYLEFIAAKPIQLDAAKRQWPISNSIFFKKALQMRQILDNPIVKKIFEKSYTRELNYLQKQLISALQQLVNEYELPFNSEDYKNSVFARCEDTNNLELLKLFVRIFRDEFDIIVEKDKEVIHTWVGESTDEFFDVLIHSLTEKQLQSRINQADFQNASPLGRAIYLHHSINLKTNQASRQDYKIKLLLKYGAKEEKLIKTSNQNKVSIINLAIMKNLPEIVLMFLNNPAAVTNNITIDGNSLLHYWAIYMPYNLEIFDKLYNAKNDKDLKFKAQQNFQNATFLHTLFSNSDVTQDQCFQVLTRIFDDYVASHAIGSLLNHEVLTYLEIVLLSQNEAGQSLLTLAETRNWKTIHAYIIKYIEMIFINLVKNKNIPKNQERIKSKLEMLSNILKYNSRTSIFVQLCESGKYDELLEHLSIRAIFKNNIFNVVGARNINYNSFVNETNELLTHEIDDDLLFEHIFDAKLDNNPSVEKIREHHLVQNLINYIPIFRLRSWRQITSALKDKGQSLEELKPKIDHFINMIKKYKFNPNHYDDNLFGIIETLIYIDNVSLTKLICEELKIQIVPHHLFKCLEFKTTNFANCKYLLDLFIAQSKNKDFILANLGNYSIQIEGDVTKPEFAYTVDLLQFAILYTCETYKIDYLIELMDQSDKNASFASSNIIIKFILRLINAQPDGLKSSFTYNYAYDVMRLLLSKPGFKEQLQSIDDATGQTLLFELFPFKCKDDNDLIMSQKIVQLLADNGCNLTHIDKSNENVFHYAAQHKAPLGFIKLLRDEIIKRYSHQKLNEMLGHVSDSKQRAIDIFMADFSKAKDKANESYIRAFVALLTPEVTPSFMPQYSAQGGFKTTVSEPSPQARNLAKSKNTMT